jgi:prepilin-type N-terminal cleavage/methylation domain-containing protein
MSKTLNSPTPESSIPTASIAPRHLAGFTLVEMMVVIAIVAVMSAMAVPALSSYTSNQRLQESARLAETVIARARGDAVRTGNIHLVFFSTDALGAPLIDESGATVQMLVVDDGRPGSANQNCLIDANEAGQGFVAETGVTLGATYATVKVPEDTGLGAFATGFTFQDAGGGAASWLMFRPDGTTRGFSSNCTEGAIGSGGGGVYITNGTRDLATIVTPLGSSRVRSGSAAGWSN